MADIEQSLKKFSNKILISNRESSPQMLIWMTLTKQQQQANHHYMCLIRQVSQKLNILR